MPIHEYRISAYWSCNIWLKIFNFYSIDCCVYYIVLDFVSNDKNNNNNNQDNVYGAVIMAEPLREFTRFI